VAAAEIQQLTTAEAKLAIAAALLNEQREG
jgi:hypothetical protein